MGYPNSSLEGLWNMEHPMFQWRMWGSISAGGLSSSVPRRVTSGQIPCVRGWRRKKEESKRERMVLPEKIQKNHGEMGQIGAFLWCEKIGEFYMGAQDTKHLDHHLRWLWLLFFQSLTPRMICQWEFVVFCDGEIKVPHIHCKINSPQNLQ